jgi:hypothetical protein
MRIAQDALAAGVGVSSNVAAAECYLFPAADLVRFGVAWLEERFTHVKSHRERREHEVAGPERDLGP